jgi:putative hemolysin
MNIFLLLLLLFCLMAEWFFAGIETGLISINRLRLRHLVRRKVPGADIIQFFLQNPDALLGTTLVGTNIAVTVSSVIAAGVGARIAGGVGSLVADLLITLVILVFCEYFPKAWFQSHPASRSLPFAPLLKYSRLVLLPISVPLMAVVKFLIPLRNHAQKTQPFVTREEIVHLASEGRSSGILTSAEHKMIHEVIQLKTKTCREIGRAHV